MCLKLRHFSPASMTHGLITELVDCEVALVSWPGSWGFDTWLPTLAVFLAVVFVALGGCPLELEWGYTPRTLR